MAWPFTTALLWLAVAQAGATQGQTVPPQGAAPGGGVPANAADMLQAEQLQRLPPLSWSPPAGMAGAIPGTLKTRADTTTAGVDLALSAEVLVGNLNEGNGASEVLVGVIVAPLVGIGVAAPAFGFTLAYNPQLYQVSLTQGPFDYLHRGWLLAEFKVAPTWRLYFAERLTYGDVDQFLPATASSTGTTGQQSSSLNPYRLGSLLYINNDTAVGLAIQFSRAARFSFLAGYQAAGGADAVSQQQMPFEQGPRAEATFDMDVNSRNTLSTKLSTQTDFFLNGPTVSVSILEEIWRLRLSRQTTAWLIGGAGAANQALATSVSGGHVAPVAGAGVQSGTESRQPLVAFAQFLLAPYIDPYLLVAAQRLALELSLNWRISSLWSAGVSGSAALVPYVGQTAEKYGSLRANGKYNVTKSFFLEAGAYWQWQTAVPNITGTLSTPNITQWGVYLSGTVKDFESI